VERDNKIRGILGEAEEMPPDNFARAAKRRDGPRELCPRA